MAPPLGRPVLAIALVAAVCTAALSAPAPAVTTRAVRAGTHGHPELTRIKVRATPYRTSDGKAVGEIPDAIVGANQRWPDDGKGVWDSATHQPAANVVRFSKEAGLDMLRYPGGTVANTFDFAKAIGPLEQRGCQTSGGFANGRFAATDSRFGPDENEQMAKAIGGESMMMVSAVNSSARARRRLRGVHELPGRAATCPTPRRHRLGRGARGQRPRQALPDPLLGVRQRAVPAGPALLVVQPTQRSGCSSSSTAAGSGRPRRTRRTRTTTGCSSAVTWPPDGPAPGSPARATGSASRPSRSPATRPARPASVTVRWPSPCLKVAGSPWTRVTSLDDQPPGAQVYTVDQVAGTVRFGDGVHGAVPPTGASLSIEYTSGIHDGFLQFEQGDEGRRPHHRALLRVGTERSSSRPWARPATTASGCTPTPRHRPTAPSPGTTRSRRGPPTATPSCETCATGWRRTSRGRVRVRTCW